MPGSVRPGFSIQCNQLSYKLILEHLVFSLHCDYLSLQVISLSGEGHVANVKDQEEIIVYEGKDKNITVQIEEHNITEPAKGIKLSSISKRKFAVISKRINILMHHISLIYETRRLLSHFTEKVTFFLSPEMTL